MSKLRIASSIESLCITTYAGYHEANTPFCTMTGVDSGRDSSSNNDDNSSIYTTETADTDYTFFSNDSLEELAKWTSFDDDDEWFKEWYIRLKGLVARAKKRFQQLASKIRFLKRN